LTLLERFFNADQAALAKIISYVENRRENFQELLSRLYTRAGRAVKIGFTGPPGAGKSTLVNGIAKLLTAEGKKIGIIAVDPTSPFTGGALLGDRIRMSDMPSDGSVYIRSMATRGSTGGLAAATDNVTIALDAFGFDYILIETVGVGQVEIDIINTCDSVVVILVPESGDSVQALKAGLMEIADIFAINKADRPMSERIVAELKSVLQIKNEVAEWKVPIIPTEAVNNKNVDLLLENIKEHLDWASKSGHLKKHRQEQIRQRIFDVFTRRIQESLLNKLGASIDLDKIVNDIYSGKTDPFKAGNELIKLADLP
jgi:LAO/AO transport system kinase